MKTVITTLSENTASRAGLLAEHGISILVETETASILLDTGQTTSVSHNADNLGVDLSKIDKIVLSHGHHDHTGGLQSVLRKMNAGIPFQRLELENLGARFNMTRNPVKITDNIMTTGEIPMVTDFEQIDPYLVVKEGNDYKPDTLMDDQALIVNTGSEIVVILGCAHHGIINTLYHAQQLTGVKQIHMVVGGCHLIGSSEERIWQTIAALKDLGVQRIGVSHCTGMQAAVIMAHEFGDSFFFNNAGTRIELE